MPCIHSFLLLSLENSPKSHLVVHPQKLNAHIQHAIGFKNVFKRDASQGYPGDNTKQHQTAPNDKHHLTLQRFLFQGHTRMTLSPTVVGCGNCRETNIETIMLYRPDFLAVLAGFVITPKWPIYA
jgi:hypothetical protein